MLQQIRNKMSFAVSMIFFAILITNVELNDNQLEQARLKWLSEKQRCSRRFTPGVCFDNVTPVWTFEYHIMNCTERLGCPQARRTNRFSSFQVCMKICQPLVDLYTQILTFEGENNTRFFLRGAPAVQIRRDGSIDMSDKLPAPPELGDQEYSGDESIMSNIMYGDADTGDNIKGDVDEVEEARDPADYFTLH